MNRYIFDNPRFRVISSAAAGRAAESEQGACLAYLRALHEQDPAALRDLHNQHDTPAAAVIAAFDQGEPLMLVGDSAAAVEFFEHIDLVDELPSKTHFTPHGQIGQVPTRSWHPRYQDEVTLRLPTDGRGNLPDDDRPLPRKQW